jgi:DNA-binding transcriptional LysR family regulator
VNSSAINWDDLRYVLALARKGTLVAAARELEVASATVGRRLAGFEADVGASVFEKTPEGWLPTPFGEALIKAARGVEESMVDVQRIAHSVDNRLAGEVRVTTAPMFLSWLVLPVIDRLRSDFPGVFIDVNSTPDVLDLSARAADIGIRYGTATVANGMRVRKLGTVGCRCYGTPRLAELPVLPIAMLNNLSPAQVGEEWIESLGDQARVVLRASNLAAVEAAIRSGRAAGFLPIPIGDSLGLVPISPVEFSGEAYVVLPSILADNTRIRAVFNAIVGYAAENRQLFME